MSLERLDYWYRQTLRAQPAMILSEWIKDRERLQKENEKLKEFVQDCAVSHNETRYKYRAKLLMIELNK